MERRNMLNLLGLGGLATWAVPGGKNENKNNADAEIQFKPTFQEVLEDERLQPGNLVTTLGYYQVNDGGGGQYKILPAGTKENSKNTSGGVFRMKSGLYAHLINVRAVNYQLFGAKADGKSDDSYAIRLAHEFANQEDIPVENLSGTYHIREVRGIPIETSVRWGSTTFFIDEKYNTSDPVFHVRSRFDPIDIPATGIVGKAIIDQLKPGVQVIPELGEYKNHLIHLHDDKDRIAFRAGNYNKRGRAREELVYVSQEGRIMGDVAWSFESTVTITALPAERSFLIVEGGTFFLSGENPVDPPSTYTHNGILVTRSRTRIQRQWVGIDPDRKDDSLTAQSGFYYFSKVYDVHLEDVRLIPREKNREGGDRDVPHGTYGIGGNRVLGLSLRGVVAEGTGIHWGVMGTNMMKNIKLQDCRINRFDVHFHLWNLTIRDSEIGNKGITITGGGKLHIENTTCFQHRFLNFRRDYGAKWDGDIFIAHCVLRPSFENGSVALMDFRASDFDYGYPIGIARSIEVQDFVVDYTNVPDNDQDCWLMVVSDYSVTGTGERLFFPNRVQFGQIRVKGRRKGVRIAQISGANGYQVDDQGSYDGDLLAANSHWTFDSVDLQMAQADLQAEEQFHLAALRWDSDDHAIEVDSPHLQLFIRNCPSFSADLTGIRIKLHVSHSTINRVVLQDNAPAQGEATFEYCTFIPVPDEQEAGSYQLDTVLGTSFLNCVIHLPLVDKEVKMKDLEGINFMVLNERLEYAHMNTRLSKGFIRFLKEKNIPVEKNFETKLLLHNGESYSS